ncbi:hypothetical protein IWZ00DRAFT_489457 [Phyllosticta capitalensis]|uniref:Uncharacterized protein n=1 Tax=Phyllosticta capitalensis TaxID=121624 RepID=A0ABR1YR65_9PEZI
MPTHSCPRLVACPPVVDSATSSSAQILIDVRRWSAFKLVLFGRLADVYVYRRNTPQQCLRTFEVAESLDRAGYDASGQPKYYASAVTRATFALCELTSLDLMR